MGKRAEILFITSVFSFSAAYAVCLICNLKDLLLILHDKPNLSITVFFLFMLFLGIGLLYLSILVFTNTFLKRCNCCKGRGLVKRVILASQCLEHHEREYNLCSKCRNEESWRHNEEFIFVKDHSVIHVSLI
ncbi:MAG: hypothetical protein WC663_00780 [Patescibacteria group bacterium]|jgi:hypothetical protein